MKIIHTMLDGTVRDSLDDVVIPRNKETNAYYKAMKKILTERGYETHIRKTDVL